MMFEREGRRERERNVDVREKTATLPCAPRPESRNLEPGYVL